MTARAFDALNPVYRSFRDFGEPDTPSARLTGKAILIHICKDGTFTFRSRREKVFNGVALAVYSVATRRQARELQTLLCFDVGAEHPDLPRQTWYKVRDVLLTGRTKRSQAPFAGECFVFDIDDLGALSRKMDAVWRQFVDPRRTPMPVRRSA